MVRYYPKIHDSDFSNICTKKEFLKYRTNRGTAAVSYADSLLLPHQQFVVNYLHMNTPYNGMLLYHETGTGKTCTAVSVAESYKEMLRSKGKKAIIISSKLVQQEFRNTIQSTGAFKCVGDAYTKLVSKTDLSEKNYVSRLDALVSENYEFFTYQNFGSQLYKSLKSKSLDMDVYKEFVIQKYSDVVIVVDEAHNVRAKYGNKGKSGDVLTAWFHKIQRQVEKNKGRYVADAPEVDDGEVDEKLSHEAIDIITKHARNVKLLFLTATPMFDLPSEIIWIVNMLIRVNNDTIKELEISDIFDENSQFRSDKSKAEFIRAIKGKVSYMRSGDPSKFPLRLEHTTETTGKFTISNVSDRHADIIAKKLNVKDSFQIKSRQLHNVGWYEKIETETEKEKQILKRYVNSGVGDDDSVSDVAFSDYFKVTVNAVTSIEEYSYIKKESTLDAFIAEFAPKIKTIVDFIEQMEDGVAFVYSNFVHHGLVPLMLALENRGYNHFSQKQNKVHILKNREINENGKTYAVITSKRELSFEKQDVIIKAAKNPDNVHGKRIRVLLASSAGSEGIDLKNIRQVHILEPHYNMSVLEQVIGRAIRTESHRDLDEMRRNCTIFYHVTRVGDSLGVEKTLYDSAFTKFRGINTIKKILQEHSVSCAFFQASNEFDLNALKNKDIINSFGENEKFMPPEYGNIYINGCAICRGVSDVSSLVQVDEETYDPRIHSRSQIFVCMKWITELFMMSPQNLLDDIVIFIQRRDAGFDKETVYYALNSMIYEYGGHIFFNRFGVKGSIRFEAPFYKFVPLYSEYSGIVDIMPLIYASPNVPLNNIPFEERVRVRTQDAREVVKKIESALNAPNFRGDGFWDTDAHREYRNNLLAECFIDKLTDQAKKNVFASSEDHPPHIKSAIRRYLSNDGRLLTIAEKSALMSKRAFPNAANLPLSGYTIFEKGQYTFKVVDRRKQRGVGINLATAGHLNKTKLVNIINYLIKELIQLDGGGIVFERYRVGDSGRQPTFGLPQTLDIKAKNIEHYLECEMLLRYLRLKQPDKPWIVMPWELESYGLPQSAK